MSDMTRAAALSTRDFIEKTSLRTSVDARRLEPTPQVLASIPERFLIVRLNTYLR